MSIKVNLSADYLIPRREGDSSHRIQVLQGWDGAVPAILFRCPSCKTERKVKLPANIIPAGAWSPEMPQARTTRS